MNTARSQLATRAALIGSEFQSPEELYDFLFEDVEESYDVFKHDFLEMRKRARAQGKWMRSVNAKRLTPKEKKKFKEYLAYLAFDVDPLNPTFDNGDD